MAERGSTFIDRRAGAQIAQATSTSDSGRALAPASAREVVEAQERCRDARSALDKLAAGDAAAQTRAAAAAERFLVERARGGDAAACSALAAALR
jgi:hypothetical protein